MTLVAATTVSHFPQPQAATRPAVVCMSVAGRSLAEVPAVCYCAKQHNLPVELISGLKYLTALK